MLDSEEFKRRTKEYDRLKYHHYYFMALKADAIIDATEKGNASRFINHSCDPNSETQKVTGIFSFSCLCKREFYWESKRAPTLLCS